MIHDLTGTPVDKMLLVYTIPTSLVRLDDTISLAEQGIKSENLKATVHVLLRYRVLGLSTYIRQPDGTFRTQRFLGG